MAMGRCPRLNSDRTLSRINPVRNPAPEQPDSRIAAQSGEGVYDAAGQMMKRKHGGAMPVGGWKS
jgi:hypothetical protein